MFAFVTLAVKAYGTATHSRQHMSAFPLKADLHESERLVRQARNPEVAAFSIASFRRQPIEQRFGLLQIARIEALGEPAIDRSEKITRFIPLALIAP